MLLFLNNQLKYFINEKKYFNIASPDLKSNNYAGILPAYLSKNKLLLNYELLNNVGFYQCVKE